MPLTPREVKKRTVRIRITGEGDEPSLVAMELANGIEGIGQKIIDWSNRVPTQDDPDVNHVYLTLERKENKNV